MTSSDPELSPACLVDSQQSKYIDFRVTSFELTLTCPDPGQELSSRPAMATFAAADGIAASFDEGRLAELASPNELRCDAPRWIQEC